jgi:hypothetical protein
MSNSKPAINMMYNKPMVAKIFIAPSDSISFSPMRLKPFGPTITPEMIKPIIAGILSFRKMIGESKMMNKMSEKIKTGFFKGK